MTARSALAGFCAVAFLLGLHAPPSRKSVDLHTAIALTQAYLYGATGLTAKAAATAPEADVLVLVSAKNWKAALARMAERRMTIRFEDARSGYVRVTVPFERVRELFEWPEIDVARVDGLAAYDTRVQQQTLTALGFWPPAGSSAEALRSPEKPLPLLTAREARQSPINGDQDMGVTAFRAEHPTFDGRGVGIGVLEHTQIPVDHPAYRSARNLDGTPRRKILRYLTHPGARRNGTGALLSDWFRCASVICEAHGRLLRLPAAGRYRLADVTLPGRSLHPRQRGAAQPVVVIQREDDGRFYADGDGNLDFSAEAPLIDFNRPEWDERSILRIASRGAAVARAVVTLDPDGAFLWIHPFSDSHATMTSTVAAGAEDEANLAVGVAPSASLVFVDVGFLGLISQAVEGLITLARDPDVDVMFAAIIISTPFGTRASFDSLALDRISASYDKPLVLSSGNAIASIFASAAPGGRVAMTAGQYINSKTTQALLGLVRPAVPVVASSVGPSYDGTPKPDFLAASKRVAGTLCDLDEGTLLQTRYQVPPCFTISGGTSAAGPSAAGAVALLLSAAKQRQLKPTVFDIRQALMASASQVPGIPAHMQGVGLIDVNKAWIAVQAPTTDAARIEGELRYPFVGMIGDATPIGLVSVDPSAEDRTMTAHVRTNAGDRIIVPVTIPAPAPGLVRSAWVALSNPAGGQALGRILAVVARPAQLDARSFQYSWTDVVGFETHQGRLIRVPPAATGLMVEAELAQGNGATVLRSPISLPMLPRSYWSGGPFFSTPVVSPPGTYAGILLDPLAGDWGVHTQDRATILTQVSLAAPEGPAPVHMNLRMTAFRTGCKLLDVRRGADDHVRVSIDDELAQPVSGGVLAAPAIVETTRVEAPDEFARHAVDITIARSTAVLRIEGTQQDGDSLMLQLFDCTAGHCLSEIQAGPSTSPILNIREPREGLWKVFAVPVKPLYRPTPIEVRVARVLASDIRSLNPMGPRAFAGDIPRRDGSSSALALRTDARAEVNKEGWGAVSACVMELPQRGGDRGGPSRSLFRQEQ